MADEDEEVVEVGAKRGSGMLLLVMLLNTIALIGGGVYFAFFHQSASAAAPAQPERKPTEIGPLVELEPIVANLSDGNATRFVKVGIHLEIVDEEKRPAVDQAIVPIRNAILLYLSGLGAEDTKGSENKQKIRDALLEKVKETIGTDDVRRVYFTEFVVQ